MAVYGISRTSVSPSITNDNWTLDAGFGKSGKVLEVTWGGELTTSTAMATRIARSSGQSVCHALCVRNALATRPASERELCPAEQSQVVPACFCS